MSLGLRISGLWTILDLNEHAGQCMKTLGSFGSFYHFAMATRKDFHSLAEARSWALHSEVSARLAERPELVERARKRVAEWLSRPDEHPYSKDWQELLDGELVQLRAALVETSDRMCTLRQASPFAGALDSRTRWQILKRPELRSP